MKLIDITRNLSEAPVYPGSFKTEVTRVNKISEGCDSNFSHIRTNTHAGTHVDATCHFVDGGPSVEQMPLELYYGPCRVLTFPEKTILKKEDLEGKLGGIKKIAIHGGGFTYMDATAARYLIDCGITTILTDAWSVAPLDNEKQIHYMILAAGIALVENVILDHVADGDYCLMAFPAKFDGCDGAPVRAVLVEEQEVWKHE